MGTSKYIGRVGGLAVALGVGMAVAATPGAAWADDTASASSGGTAGTADATGSSGPSESEGPSTTTETTPETTDPSTAAGSQTAGASTAGSGSVGAPTSDTSASTAASVRQVPRGMVLTTGGKHSPSRSSSDTSAQGDVAAESTTDDTTPPQPVADSTSPDPEAPAAVKAPVGGPRGGSDERQRLVHEPAGAPGVEVSAVAATAGAASSRPPEAAELARTVLDGALDEHAAPQVVTALTARPFSAPQTGVVARQAISAAPEEPTPPRSEVSGIVLGVLASLGPLTTDGPMPVDSPLGLALMAVGARPRQVGQAGAEETRTLPFSSTLTSRSVDSEQTFAATALAASTTTTTAITTADVAPTVNAPDDANGGTVTGSVNVGELDGNTSTTSSYTVTGQPTNGTVTVDQGGGFTYTPTPSARLSAGTTPGADTDSFTVTVTDGQASTNVTVTVPISSTQAQLDPAITVGPGPSGMVVSGNYAYVANQGTNTVSVFDTRTGALVDTNPSSPAVVDPITVGGVPTGMAASPDGNRVYVTNQGDGTLSVIDTNPTSVTYNKVISTVKVGTSPSAVAVGTDGRVYVANTGSGTVSVITFTGSSHKISTVTVGSAPAALAVSPTTGQVYVANRGSNTVSVISTSNKVIKTITVGSQPTSVAITPDGKRVYVVNTGSATVSVINTATNTLVDTNPGTFAIDPIAVGPSPTSVTISPDGGTAFVANGNDTLSVIDLRPTSATYNTVITTVAIDPTAPEPVGGHAIAINPATGTIYVSDAVDGTVRVVSLVHVNTAPQTTGDPTIISADETTGAVKGSLSVTDIDGDKLTYTTTSGPASGTVTYDAAAGTYTYTPTEAARQLAATTEGEDYDRFTVTVSDGQGGTTTVDVKVTISPTAQTNPTTIAVGQLPNAVVISGAQGNQAYVTNYYDGTVSVIDTTTNEVRATIAVGASPRSLAASPDGSSVYVLNQDDSTVSVIDTTTNQVTDTVTVTVPPDPSGSVSRLWDVAVGRDGTVYVSASRGTISVIEPTTHEVSGPYSVGPAATGIVVSPDGSRLYVATELWNSEMMVVDSDTMQVVDTVDVGYWNYPIDAEFTPDGKRLYVITGAQGSETAESAVMIVDTAPTSATYNQVIQTIYGGFPQAVAFSSDRTRAYVSDAGTNTITLIDTRTNQVIGTITVPLTPVSGSHDIAISSDGHWLYVTDQVGNAVIVVSVDSMTPTTV